MDINVFFSKGKDRGSPMADVAAAVFQLTERIDKMATSLQDLVDKVNQQSGTVESMKTFIGGLEQTIRDALQGVSLSPEQQQKVNEAFQTLNSNTQAIADAIDNDPATPAGAPAPAPAPAGPTTAPGGTEPTINPLGGKQR